MRDINKVSIAAMIAMAVVSFTNLFGIKAAGVSVIIGVVLFFVNKLMERRVYSGSGLDFEAIGSDIKKKSLWFWICLPIVMDAVSITLAKLYLPEYIEHVIGRAEVFVTFDKAALLLVQLAVLALGEEIAWRAFFQKQLVKVMSLAPVLFISSLLFALGHVAKGSFIVVAYDVFFVFVNSILYGIIFQRSNNAWISGISHFAANLFSIIVLVF